MTTSEIADWLTVGGDWASAAKDHEGADKHYQAAATIRAQAEALKIATEALEEIGAQTMSMHVSIDDLARHGIRSANQALARIKEAGA